MELSYPRTGYENSLRRLNCTIAGNRSPRLPLGRPGAPTPGPRGARRKEERCRRAAGTSSNRARASGCSPRTGSDPSRYPTKQQAVDDGVIAGEGGQGPARDQEGRRHDSVRAHLRTRSVSASRISPTNANRCRWAGYAWPPPPWRNRREAAWKPNQVRCPTQWMATRRKGLKAPRHPMRGVEGALHCLRTRIRIQSKPSHRERTRCLRPRARDRRRPLTPLPRSGPPGRPPRRSPKKERRTAPTSLGSSAA